MFCTSVPFERAASAEGGRILSDQEHMHGRVEPEAERPGMVEGYGISSDEAG